MHEKQRRAVVGASANIEIGHVVSVNTHRLQVGQSSARYAKTISPYFCGACSNIGWVAPGIISVRDPFTLVASARSTFGSVPLVLAPPMNSVGVFIASASVL